jgi:hypothetical protein
MTIKYWTERGHLRTSVKQGLELCPFFFFGNQNRIGAMFRVSVEDALSNMYVRWS